MNLHAILIRSPINRQAGGGITHRRPINDEPLTREELLYLMQRLARKCGLLKKTLGIRNRTHLKNLKYRYNKGRSPHAIREEPRAWTELKVCGEQLLKMQQEIQRLRLEALE